MEKLFNYVTKLDIKFDHLKRIDIPQMVKECKDQWFNQTLTQVNDNVVSNLSGNNEIFSSYASTFPGPSFLALPI